MGNCSFRGFDPYLYPVRVMTPEGQVLEFSGPKLVSEVIKDFPRHGIFKKDKLSSPLDHRELLIGGQFYHLLEEETSSELEYVTVAEVVPARKVAGSQAASDAEPVRMSTSTVALQLVTKNLSDGSGFEVLPPPQKGVWKVKLLIDTKQLEEILSEEVNTEALIEKMRAAATSSTTVVPPQRKGYWVTKLKPIFCNVLNKTVAGGTLLPKSVTPML